MKQRVSMTIETMDQIDNQIQAQMSWDESELGYSTGMGKSAVKSPQV
jgi:hypothetical protein